MAIATVARVADASVIAALVFGEVRRDEAAALLDSGQLYEPSLLGYELASVARTKCIREPDRKESIIEAFELAMRLEIEWIEVEHPAVLSLALQTGLTTYDASYLYIARTLGLPLVTFDARLLAVLEGNTS